MYYASKSKKGAIIAADSENITAKSNSLIATPLEGTLEARLRFGFRLNLASASGSDSLQSYNCHQADSLEDMLQAMYDKNHDIRRIGILTRKGSRLLEKEGDYCEFYDSLMSNLHTRSLLERKRSDNKYLKSRKSIDKQISRVKKNIRSIISAAYSYKHGPIEKFFVRRHLKSCRSKLPEQRTRKGSILIALGRPVENLDYVHRELGADIHAMVNFPILSLKGDEKDIRKISACLSGRRFSRFSKKSEHFFRNVVAYEPVKAVYVPEKYQQPKIVSLRNLWNLELIGAPKANDIASADGVRVAVIDTGVDYRHREISGCFEQNKGIDFVDGGEPLDRAGHGTHVAGTIAGSTVGVAPDATLYAVRVLNENGVGFLDDVLKGVDWCITKKMHIANLSLGSSYRSDIEEYAYNVAYERGLLCIAAAGNEGYGPSYPSSYESVISVAAVDRFCEHADFSNVYHTVNVSAPGVGILSSLPGGDMGVLSGTSMATPHVAGVAALAGPMDKDSFLQKIMDTSKPLGDPLDPDNKEKYGFGLIRADDMVAKWRKIA